MRTFCPKLKPSGIQKSNLSQLRKIKDDQTKIQKDTFDHLGNGEGPRINGLDREHLDGELVAGAGSLALALDLVDGKQESQRDW